MPYLNTLRLGSQRAFAALRVTRRYPRSPIGFTGKLVQKRFVDRVRDLGYIPFSEGLIIKPPAEPFALCIDNTDYQASLIVGKVYRILPDAQAAKDDFVRIVDESGEDYLFHKRHFVFVDFPHGVKKKILALNNAAS